MRIRERLEQARASDTLDAIMARAEHAAEQFRLPFGQRSWRGQTGNWAGAGVGSSIDFQDHRPYVPGDDPRYINWQAYARSGNYTMKLYREEVSPQVDLVLDLSASLFLEPGKAVRTLELFYFACHSAWRQGALLNVIHCQGGNFTLPQSDGLRAGDWPIPEKPESENAWIDWIRLPWRNQSMRLVISDFLFEQDPGEILGLCSRQAGSVVLWAVFTQAEAAPGWLGNIELLDCESDKRIRRYFTKEDCELYRQRYEEHFNRWSDAATRYSASFSRFSAQGELGACLLEASGLKGGVELCR